MGAPLGQHFLKTPGPARALAKSLSLSADDVVVEVGPGHGELTRHLLAAPHRKIVAVERDVRLAAALVHNVAKEHPSLEVVHGDIRSSLSEVAANLGKNWKIAGNIPYYLTSFLLRLIGDLPNPPERVALLMQQEVAERAAAGAGEYNKLAAFCGAWASAEVVERVPRTAFSPPPKVNSAILLLTRRETAPKNREAYDDFVRRAFAQPRKTLLNNLTSSASEKASALKLLESAGLTERSRPQDLSAELVECLAGIFPAQAGKS